MNSSKKQQHDQLTKSVHLEEQFYNSQKHIIDKLISQSPELIKSLVSKLNVENQLLSTPKLTLPIDTNAIQQRAVNTLFSIFICKRLLTEFNQEFNRYCLTLEAAIKDEFNVSEQFDIKVNLGTGTAELRTKKISLSQNKQVH
ncbi:MAG: hypothetical protein OCD00_03805 [Colwellia sp.]